MFRRKVFRLLTFIVATRVLVLAVADAGNETDLAQIGEWFAGIDTWSPPESMVKELPYYLSGYDYDGRPIYILEFGKWNVSKYVESDVKENRDNLYRRNQKLWYEASRGKSPVEGAEDGFVQIVDMNGYALHQLLSPQVIKFQLWNMRMFEYVGHLVSEVYFLNMNFVASQWVNLVRPVAGNVIGRAHILGTGIEKISSTLRQKIPKDQLPPWLGGSETWKPVLVR